MPDVAIVTDSTVCLPKELIKEHGITIVPMEFIHEGKIYRDGLDITPTEFYRLLSKAEKLPTTSAPSPGTYLAAFQKIDGKTRAILVIAPSAKLSHAFESAKAAAELSREKLHNVAVEVLDCGTAAGAQGLVVLAAARAAALGENVTGVLKAARKLMPVVHLVAFIDTLRYLAKGGRVPQVIAWANALLKIKPIFELLPLWGGAAPAGKVRVRLKATERLLKYLRASMRKNPGRSDGKLLHCIVMHANVRKEAEELKERLTSEFDCAEIYIEDFTPVMGVHTGPGLLGLAFYTDGRSEE